MGQLCFDRGTYEKHAYLMLVVLLVMALMQVICPSSKRLSQCISDTREIFVLRKPLPKKT